MLPTPTDTTNEALDALMEMLIQTDKTKHNYYSHPMHNRDGNQAAAAITALRAERDALAAKLDSTLKDRALIRAERDAALAKVTALRHEIQEASDPDFLWCEIDNLADMGVELHQYPAALSKAIRATISTVEGGAA